jgi:hypothetical protein
VPKDRLYILFNDHLKNAEVLRQGEAIAEIGGGAVNNGYSNSACFLLTIDMLTGTYKRTFLFYNHSGGPPVAPRFSTVIDGCLYIVRLGIIEGSLVHFKSGAAVGKIALAP